MSSDSDEDWCSEEWIRKKLNWRGSPDQGEKPDKSLSLAKSNVDKVNNDVIDLSDTIDVSSCEEGESELEEEIKVAFIQESNKINRFSVLPSDRFKSVFEAIANFKKVPASRIELVMMPNTRDVSPYDSLSSLNYSVCNYFYAYVIDENKSVSNSKGTGSIEIVCVAPNKENFIYKMEDKQPLDILISFCARDLKLERSKFKLVFDGEIVKPSDTCSSLDIADQDLIEIHFIS